MTTESQIHQPPLSRPILWRSRIAALHLSRALYKFTLFMQNKPNFPRFCLKNSLSQEKQTQFKPNSNPSAPKTNPIQTQFAGLDGFSLTFPAKFNRIIMVNKGVFPLFSRIYSEVKMKIRTIASIVLVLFVFPAIGLAQDVHVYTVDMTKAHTQLVSSSPYVTPTASGDACLALPGCPIPDFVVGVSAGNVGDPCVPQHNLYAYKITDPAAAGNKTKVVIDTGNHNTETPGSWTFQGMVDFLVSSEPAAIWLRQVAEFYVYPLVNPDGRYTGTGRGNPEMTAEGFGTDHNRVWNTQGQGLSTIDALTTAMQNDTGGDVDYLLDFHNGTSNPLSFNVTADLVDCPYVQTLLEIEPALSANVSAGQPGMLRIWSMTAAPNGLSADYTFTPESNFDHDAAYFLNLGRSYGLALGVTLYRNLLFDDSIYVYTVDMTEAHTQIASLSPYVTPTPSGDANLALDANCPIADFVVGVSAGNVGGDPNVPQHNLYAYKITDPAAAGPKTKVVIDTGNHNTETSGSWAFQGYVDFLLSSDPNAQWLRQVAEFYIYPLVNPDGRYTGIGRGNPEMTAEGFGTDHNRVWNTQGQGLSTIDALTTAMQNDTDSNVGFLFDFHTAGGSNPQIYVKSSMADSPYILALMALDTDIVINITEGVAGMLRIWSLTPEGLNAEYAFTPESDNNGDVPYYLDLGCSYGLALHNTLAGVNDVTDYNDLKILADNWLTDNLEVQTGKLVGFWQLDESGGTAAPDSSGNGHNGTLNNGPLWQPSGGRFDGAISFDEVNDYLEIPDFSYTNGADEFTLCFWFKIDDVAGSLYQYMFSHGNWDTNNSLSVYLRESSATSSPEQVTTNIKLNDGTEWQPNTGITLADGQWHMYAITVSSADGAEIFIDANSIGTDSSVKGSSFNPGTNIHLASRCDYNIDRYFGNSAADDGLLDDVRIYNYPLSSDDIELLYQGSTPTPPSQYICIENPPGDLNDDCIVNFLDYALLAADWLK